MQQQQQQRQCPILTCHGDNGAVGASFKPHASIFTQATHSEINKRHLLPRRVSNICSLRPEPRDSMFIMPACLTLQARPYYPELIFPPPPPSCHVWELSNPRGGDLRDKQLFSFSTFLFFECVCVCGGVSKTRMRRRRGKKKKKKKQRWQVGLKFVGMALERGGSGVRENM